MYSTRTVRNNVTKSNYLTRALFSSGPQGPSSWRLTSPPADLQFIAVGDRPGMVRSSSCSAINQKSAISHHAVSSKCMHSRTSNVCVCGVKCNVCCGVVYKCCSISWQEIKFPTQMHLNCIITTKCARNISPHHYDEYATNYIRNKISMQLVYFRNSTYASLHEPPSQECSWLVPTYFPCLDNQAISLDTQNHFLI